MFKFLSNHFEKNEKNPKIEALEENIELLNAKIEYLKNKLSVVNHENTILENKILEEKKIKEETLKIVEKQKKIIEEKIAREKFLMEKQKKVYKRKVIGLEKKQLEIIEKNIRTIQNENESFKNQIKNINKIIPNKNWTYSYLVRIEDFLTGAKFSDVVEKLEKAKKKYIQDLNLEILEKLLASVDGKDETLQKFKNYEDGIIEWDIKTTLLRGDRVKKVFQKNRKFLNFISDKNIEFMSDLDEFDFESLLEENFTSVMTKEIKEKYEKYNSTMKML